MVKEYVDHERSQAGQAPIAALAMYRSTPQPDWWPSGVPVSFQGGAGRGGLGAWLKGGAVGLAAGRSPRSEQFGVQATCAACGAPGARLELPLWAPGGPTAAAACCGRLRHVRRACHARRTHAPSRLTAPPPPPAPARSALPPCSGDPRRLRQRTTAPACTVPPARCWPQSTTSAWSDVAPTSRASAAVCANPPLRALRTGCNGHTVAAALLYGGAEHCSSPASSLVFAPIASVCSALTKYGFCLSCLVSLPLSST